MEYLNKKEFQIITKRGTKSHISNVFLVDNFIVNYYIENQFYIKKKYSSDKKN